MSHLPLELRRCGVVLHRDPGKKQAVTHAHDKAEDQVQAQHERGRIRSELAGEETGADHGMKVSIITTQATTPKASPFSQWGQRGSDGVSVPKASPHISTPTMK